MIRKITLKDLTEAQRRKAIRARIDRVRNQLGNVKLSSEEANELREKLLELTKRLRQ